VIYRYGSFRLLDDLLQQYRRSAALPPDVGRTGSQRAVLAAFVVLTVLIARDQLLAAGAMVVGTARIRSVMVFPGRRRDEALARSGRPDPVAPATDGEAGPQGLAQFHRVLDGGDGDRERLTES